LANHPESGMIIVCPGCQAKYKFDEAKLGDRPKAKTRCAKCGASIEIENPLLGAMTLPPGTMPPVERPAPQDEPTAETPVVVVEDKAGRATAVVSRHEGGDAVGSATITGKDLHKLGLLELPKDKRFSLAVIQGAATGQIYQISKTRTTLGRAGADIVLDDPEASRQHAVLEIIGETAIVRDLGSTNGTFVDMQRIEQQVLQNHMEFRIGSHVLMFIVTEVE
jgi:predicted Zn finger-like uncharacterized protein